MKLKPSTSSTFKMETLECSMPMVNCCLYLMTALAASEALHYSLLLYEVLEDSYSLWLRIPFGLTRHGEALIKREGDERAGSLICDGGQLLNWEANNRAHIRIKDTAQAFILRKKKTFIC